MKRFSSNLLKSIHASSPGQSDFRHIGRRDNLRFFATCRFYYRYPDLRKRKVEALDRKRAYSAQAHVAAHFDSDINAALVEARDEGRTGGVTYTVNSFDPEHKGKTVLTCKNWATKISNARRMY